MSKRTSIIFSILVGYIVFQFLWWEVLLVRQSNQIIGEKQKIVALSSTDDSIIRRDIDALHSKRTMRVYMIVSEGTVFLLILLFGIYQVRKSIRKETELANQQKNFILSVSHELKTPIAASKLQLQTLLKHELDRDKQKQLLTNALTETDRLHKLVDNVLLANQIEKNNVTILKERINLSELVEQTIQRYFQVYLENRMITTSIEKEVFYEGDKDLLPSVIINFIENAIKYSFDQVNVHVSLKTLHHKAVLEVADKGCGVPDQEKEIIFEKFYRMGNEDTRKTKGTGIGLFIVKRICNLHQAKIKVIDNLPQGSIFQVQF